MIGSGFKGFDFSHEGVKRVIGLLKGFVHAIASAPLKFLYLSYLEINEHMIKKKKKKKKPLVVHNPLLSKVSAGVSLSNIFQLSHPEICCDSFSYAICVFISRFAHQT